MILPVHPRTRTKIVEQGLDSLQYPHSNLRLIDPVGYLDMLQLEQNARMILTDSGGIQKEAYFLGIPCITLRPATEWIETVEAGWNRLVAANTLEIVHNVQTFEPPHVHEQLYGNGAAAEKCVAVLSGQIL